MEIIFGVLQRLSISITKSDPMCNNQYNKNDKVGGIDKPLRADEHRILFLIAF